jgi:periplasmic protein TonB
VISRGHSLRWILCFAAALCFHAAGAAALMTKWTADADASANPPLVMVDLAPEAAAPTIEPNDTPPDPVLSHREEPAPDPEPTKPIEQAELSPPDVKPDVVLPPPLPKVVEQPKEKKVEKKREKKRSVAAAPRPADRHAERAAAPLPGARSLDLSALPTWRSELVARLERFKRYPSDARGESGTTQVAFRVDRAGGVHNAHIARSSGSSELDRETLSLLQRAQPFPAPPAALRDSDLSLVAPVRYNAR